jgi:anti-sigma B factor antagonist
MLFMSHEIRERERDGIAILDLKGRLALGFQDSGLAQHLEVLLNAGKKNAIVNLHEVSAIDAPIMAALNRYAEEFQRAGGRLVLLNPIRDHLPPDEVFQLDTTVQAYTDEQEAINSFFPDRKVPHYDLLEFLEEETHHQHEPEVQEKPK